MLILFDHGTPRGLAKVLVGHTVVEAKARGWDRLTNGELLKAEEDTSFELLVTGRRIRYQQDLAGRTIAIVVLCGSTRWSRVRMHLERIVATVNACVPSDYVEIPIPSVIPTRVRMKRARCTGG
jgi:hypothetical protein